MRIESWKSGSPGRGKNIASYLSFSVHRPILSFWIRYLQSSRFTTRSLPRKSLLVHCCRDSITALPKNRPAPVFRRALSPADLFQVRLPTGVRNSITNDSSGNGKLKLSGQNFPLVLEGTFQRPFV